jgi:uncharacterized damage-inducible protein DinB
MNANALRQLYEYHFAENRKIWDTYIIPLSQEQFIQPATYSVGSVRNQVVHLMSCDDFWFSGLRGLEMPDMRNPDLFPDRKTCATICCSATPYREETKFSFCGRY